MHKRMNPHQAKKAEWNLRFTIVYKHQTHKCILYILIINYYYAFWKSVKVVSSQIKVADYT